MSPLYWAAPQPRPMRMQIVCFNRLAAEVIGTSHDLELVWARYVNAKIALGLPAGGAAIQRADLPRYWDVPVGSELPK